jgi:hypothetical protein
VTAKPGNTVGFTGVGDAVTLTVNSCDAPLFPVAVIYEGLPTLYHAQVCIVNVPAGSPIATAPASKKPEKFARGPVFARNTVGPVKAAEVVPAVTAASNAV